MKSLLAQTVQRKLETLRREQGTLEGAWTQNRLAEQMGLNGSTLSEKLSHKRPLSLAEAAQLAEFLGFDLNSMHQLVVLSEQ